jgi:hypothetical protein
MTKRRACVRGDGHDVNFDEADYRARSTMMLVPIVAAATAATLGLTVSSVRNIAQTFQVSRTIKAGECSSPSWVPPASVQDAVSQLESMKRKDILELFLSCEAPINTSEIEGEWNGRLLAKNGWILVSKCRMSRPHSPHLLTLCSHVFTSHNLNTIPDYSNALLD